MRRMMLCLILLIVGSNSALYAEAPVPWDELRSLLEQNVERKLRDELEPREEIKNLCSLDTANYRIDVADDTVSGTVTFTGHVLSGKPASLPLLGAGAILTAVKDVSGASARWDAEQEAMLLYPDPLAESFSVSVDFLIEPSEESGTWSLSMAIPFALTNSATVALPPGFALVQHPGVRDEAGVCHFPPASCLTLQYLNTQQVRTTAVEADLLSRIALQKDRVLVTTFVEPSRPLPENLTLQAPDGAEWVSSSLRSSSVQAADNAQYVITLPPGDTRPFSVEFALPIPADTSVLDLRLPGLLENRGQQGRLIIDQPDDAQISVEAAGISAPLPLERLGASFGDAQKGASFYFTVPEERVSLSMQRFQAVEVPPAVLENVWLYASIEESGNTLCTLAMDVPAEYGQRLNLKAVPEASIWSLTVNGIKRDLFSKEGEWVIPLDGQKASHVELAFLRTGPKLGLEGALDVIVPETGLLSQNLMLAIALPERVELLSVDGPISSSSIKAETFPAGFAGKPYFFSRAYYRGEAMELSVAYKEPVNPTDKIGATK